MKHHDPKAMQHSRSAPTAGSRRWVGGVVLGAILALALAACSTSPAPSDPYAGKDLKSLLPNQQSVIAKFDSGWSADLKPADQKVRSTPTKAPAGSKCQAAMASLQSGGDTVTGVAAESFVSSTEEPEVVALYRFPTSGDATAWKSAARSVGTYCPEEFASDPNSAKISAISDADTGAVGFTTQSGSDGRWDLVAVRGTLGVFVESQSSKSDADQLTVLASQRLAQSAP